MVLHEPVLLLGDRFQRQQVAGPQRLAVAQRGIRRGLSLPQQRVRPCQARAAKFIRLNELIIDNRVAIPLVNTPESGAAVHGLRVALSAWDSHLWQLKDWYREGQTRGGLQYRPIRNTASSTRRAKVTSANAVRCAAMAAMTVGFQHYALAAQPASATSWDGFTTNFIEATFKARPRLPCGQAGMNLMAGYRIDATDIKKEIKRLHDTRTRALSFKDNALSDKQRFERDYIVATIDGSLFWLETADWPARSPDFTAGGSTQRSISHVTTRRCRSDCEPISLMQKRFRGRWSRSGATCARRCRAATYVSAASVRAASLALPERRARHIRVSERRSAATGVSCCQRRRDQGNESPRRVVRAAGGDGD